MSEDITNVAYVVTEGCIHIGVWIYDEQNSTPGKQGQSWTTTVSTVCGRKKSALKTSYLVYQGSDTPLPIKPYCKLCKNVVNSAQRLLTA